MGGTVMMYCFSLREINAIQHCTHQQNPMVRVDGRFQLMLKQHHLLTSQLRRHPCHKTLAQFDIESRQQVGANQYPIQTIPRRKSASHKGRRAGRGPATAGVDSDVRWTASAPRRFRWSLRPAVRRSIAGIFELSVVLRLSAFGIAVSIPLTLVSTIRLRCRYVLLNPHPSAQCPTANRQRRSNLRLCVAFGTFCPTR